MSPWVTLWVARHVIDWPGAREVPLTGVHVPSTALASVMVTEAIVVLPSLVAVIE